MFLITGASGFIGSNLIAALEKRGHKKIVACDVLDHAEKWQNLAKRDLYDFITPDHLSHFLEKNKNQIEVIFHLGAISSTDAADGNLVLKTNYTLSRDLFDWCARQRVRFIYASSAATYGKGEHGFDDRDDNDYLSQLRPLNLYGWSKHAFDRTVKQVTQDKESPHPPQWAGLKFFNVYGPNEYHKGSQSSVIPHFLKQIQHSKEARLFKSCHPDYKDGQQKRDFVYVDDAVDVMIWLYENQNICGLFNVGTGTARTFDDVAASLFNTMGLPVNIDYIPLPERLMEHYQYYTQASMGKLQTLGYLKPFHTIEEGIKKYLQQYLLTHDIYR